MVLFEASLAYQAINYDAADRLGTTRQLITYLTAGAPEYSTETFWVACMNPNRRPIGRAKLQSGVLVASRVHARDVCLTLLLAEAKSFACLRVQPNGSVQPTLADSRLAFNLRETAKQLEIEFVDYLITRLDGDEFYSWRESARRAG